MFSIKVGALKALKILANAPFEKSEHYYYKHAQKIIERAPMEASTNFLARYENGLEPTKLLPAFIAYEKRREDIRNKEIRARKKVFERGPLLVGEMKEGLSDENHNPFADSDDETTPDSGEYIENNEEATIKYFEGVIRLGCDSTAVYSYLISILVKLDDEEPLHRFLSQYVNPSPLSRSVAFEAEESSPIDLYYILRTLLKSGRHFRSTIKIYMGLGMLQQAVELALKVDPALARELARESSEETEKKQLWLMIAKNVASEDHGGRDTVSKVLSVIKDCGPETLSIEDVLPFLPDSAQIDQFRDEICEALTAYSSKIDQYVQEMSECDQACEALRVDIESLGKLGTQMRADARCAFTGKIVLDADEPFYVFPSGFVALESALKNEVVPFLNVEQRIRVDSIEKDLKDLKRRKSVESRDTRHREEILQSELDGLIAAECPLTGRIMVESIERGFTGMDSDIL